MANFGLYDKPYIKVGTSNTVCYCCIKDECETTRRNAHDVTHDHLGKLENKMVFYIRRSGQDTCICFDCFKKLYENIIAAEMPVENDEKEQEPVAKAVETPVASTENAEEQKATTKKSNKSK